MRPSAFIGALAGAGLGALLWAGVAYLTGLEIGWIAWAVGGMVGLGAAVLGGQGASTGAACAVLSIVAIVAGKFLGVDMIAEKEIRKAADLVATTDIYNQIRINAEAFAEVTSEDEYGEFMIDYGFTFANYPEDISSLEMAAFKKDSVPELRRFHSTNPSFAQWKEHAANEAVRIWNQEGSISEVVKENLSPIDAIFGLLGVVTAFQVGARGVGGAGGPQRIPRGEPISRRPAYGSTRPQYGSADRHVLPEAQAPLLQDEPPNPYAQPAPPSRVPREPMTPRKIPRLGPQHDAASEATEPRPAAQPREPSSLPHRRG